MSAGTVAMVVRNAVIHDTRVLREASALADAGYAVTVFGLRTATASAGEERDGVRIVRLVPRGVLYGVLTWIVALPRRAEKVWKRVVRRVLVSAGRDRATTVGTTRLAPIFDAARWALTPVMRLRQRVASFAFQATAARAMATLRPVAYHCHDFQTLWAGHRAARLHVAPVVYDAHEIYRHQNLPNLTRRRTLLVRLVERTVLRRAAAVVTVNDSIATWYEDAYRIARPVVVRNIPSFARADLSTSAVDLPEGPVLLYLGGIGPGRGLEPIIGALGLLPGVALVLLGPVPREAYVETLRALAARTGVLDRLTVLPPVPPSDVVGVAARATIGLVLIEDVCLSYRLSLPNKLFECMHAGLPVVASDLPEIAAVVRGHGVGVTCDPSDPEAIARAVRELLADPKRLDGMRAAARAASSLFTWEREADTLCALYARIAPLQGAPSAPAGGAA